LHDAQIAWCAVNMDTSNSRQTTTTHKQSQARSRVWQLYALTTCFQHNCALCCLTDGCVAAVCLLLLLFCVLQLPAAPPEGRQAQTAGFKAMVQRCCLALVLLWARWRQGEPVIVRDCEVRGRGGGCVTCRAVYHAIYGTSLAQHCSERPARPLSRSHSHSLV
jgi:hypothetical protein